MRHFTISKYNFGNGERVVLHEGVPEGIADWLCDQPLLSKKDEMSGFTIMKELEVVPRQAVSSRTRAANRKSRSPVKRTRAAAA